MEIQRGWAPHLFCTHKESQSRVITIGDSDEHGGLRCSRKGFREENLRKRDGVRDSGDFAAEDGGEDDGIH